MMGRPALPGWALGLVLGLLGAGVVVGLGVWWNRGWQTRLEGRVLKARTVATDTESSIVVLELRLNNPARALFLVREVNVELTTGAGKRLEGQVVAEPDLDRVLAYYPAVGPRYNSTLKAREKLRAGETADRTVAASFPVSEKELLTRRGLVVRIEDADGARAEIAEQAGR